MTTTSAGLDNPFFHLLNAELLVSDGDQRVAELAYKTSIITSDNLPLLEYRSDFARELRKFELDPSYQPAAGVDLEQVTEAYAKLLVLPVSTRIGLVFLWHHQGMAAEALELLQEAISIGLDPMVANHSECKRVMAQIQRLTWELRQLPGQRDFAAGYSGSWLNRRVRKPGDLTLSQLIALYGQFDVDGMWASHRRPQAATPDVIAQACTKLSAKDPLVADPRAVLEDMYCAAQRFIDDLAKFGRVSAADFTWTDPFETDDYIESNAAYGTPQAKSIRFYRARVSNDSWSLSLRTDGETVEVFLVPTPELLNGPLAENGSTSRGKFRWYGPQQPEAAYKWASEGFPAYADDAWVSVRSALKELIQHSEEFNKGQTKLTESLVGFRSGMIMRKLFELTQQRKSLSEKLVYQHESLQNRIARDIHDAVVADVLALKRTFGEGGIPLPAAEVANSLHNIAHRLRNICQDLSTRDLQDWGLSVAIHDILNRVAQRSAFEPIMISPAQLPELPAEVELHLYRIVQECLNNIEKHAQAERVTIEVAIVEGLLTISVEDDGIGFDPYQRDTRKPSEGSMGLHTVRERVGLIQSHYPAQIWIRSQVNSGTKISVQINLRKLEEKADGRN